MKNDQGVNDQGKIRVGSRLVGMTPTVFQLSMSNEPGTRELDAI